MKKKPAVENLAYLSRPGQDNNATLVYAERIETLKEQAIEDGYVLDESSYNNFHKFLEKFPRLVRADLVLLENGELVAIWNGENGTEVGLQFQKDSRVQYILFNGIYSNCADSILHGMGGYEETMKKIKKYDFDKIMFE